jgi:ribosome maturation factor RimP
MEQGNAREANIQALVEPILSEHQLELVELACRPQGRQLLVRLLVDRVGGVTIQHCARVNRLIGEALEQANLIEGSYTVEVSSPGVDRSLVSRRDFERVLGRTLRLELAVELGRSRTLEGMLLAVQSEALVMKTPEGNITVPLSKLRHATQALRW